MEPFIVTNVDGGHPDSGTNRIHVGLDIGQRKWVGGLLDLSDWSFTTVCFSGDDAWQQCVLWLDGLKAEGRSIHVLYEAGRNGFELARQLRDMGIDVDIVAVARLDLGKRRKRGRSDRLDAKRLAYMDFSAPGFPVVWTPSEEHECMRGVVVHWEGLVRQKRRLHNGCLSILARWGVAHREQMTPRMFDALVQDLQGRLPKMEEDRVLWLWKEEKRVDGFLKKLQKQMEGHDRRLRRAAHDAGREYDVDRLVRLRGVGIDSARRICWYVGDFGRFSSGRRFAAYCGLTPVHERSGKMDVDKGISKAGNVVLRRTLVQLAQLFFQWQPECEVVKKWTARRGESGSCRRVAKVALAREIAVLAWRYLVNDEWPNGARE